MLNSIVSVIRQLLVPLLELGPLQDIARAYGCCYQEGTDHHQWCGECYHHTPEQQMVDHVPSPLLDSL